MLRQRLGVRQQGRRQGDPGLDRQPTLRSLMRSRTDRQRHGWTGVDQLRDQESMERRGAPPRRPARDVGPAEPVGVSRPSVATSAATTLNVYAHFLQQADRNAAEIIGQVISLLPATVG